LFCCRERFYVEFDDWKKGLATVLRQAIIFYLKEEARRISMFQHYLNGSVLFTLFSKFSSVLRNVFAYALSASSCEREEKRANEPVALLVWFWSWSSKKKS